MLALRASVDGNQNRQSAKEAAKLLAVSRKPAFSSRHSALSQGKGNNGAANINSGKNSNTNTSTRTRASVGPNFNGKSGKTGIGQSAPGGPR